MTSRWFPHIISLTMGTKLKLPLSRMQWTWSFCFWSKTTNKNICGICIWKRRINQINHRKCKVWQKSSQSVRPMQLPYWSKSKAKQKGTGGERLNRGLPDWLAEGKSQERRAHISKDERPKEAGRNPSPSLSARTRKESKRANSRAQKHKPRTCKQRCKLWAYKDAGSKSWQYTKSWIHWPKILEHLKIAHDSKAADINAKAKQERDMDMNWVTQYSTSGSYLQEPWESANVAVVLEPETLNQKYSVKFTCQTSGCRINL